MSGNRKAVEAFIIKYIDKIIPDGENKAYYEKIFSSMSDNEFKKLMEDFRDGVRYLTIRAPNFSKVKLNTKRNIEIGKELNLSFFQKLWIGPTDSIPAYQTVPCLVCHLPVRRASQMLINKISVAQNNRVIDQLTGQPTGDSKGSKLSLPEIRVLSSLNMDNTIVELIKMRGGDTKGWRALNDMMSRYGNISLKTLENYSSGVESTKTLKTYLAGAHLKSTL